MSNVTDLETARLERDQAAGEAAHAAGEAWALEVLDDESIPDSVGLIEHPTHPIIVASTSSLLGFALTRDGAHALVRELIVALNTKVPVSA